MRIVDLTPHQKLAIEEVAGLLVSGFAEEHPEAWPDKESARAEIRDSFGSDRLSLIAIDDIGHVLGWIGAIAQYDGRVWELHPMVVAREFQRKGIGRALVEALEARARDRGGLTTWLGTDDENGQTSLSDVDLYDDLLGRLGTIRNLNNHPFGFYQRLGYTLAGVLPDANGIGKPDIFMAKRLSEPPGRIRPSAS